MATFRRGLDAEDRICTKLEGFGCRIQRDPRLDHKHKLDFVITNYIDNPNFYAFGVQITTKVDLLEKQEEFLKANQSSRVTTKALYLELSDKLDLEDGGALAVLSVILDFQFNRSYAGLKLSAARIYEDLTYQFYDLGARVNQLRERAGEQLARQEYAGQPTGRAAVTPISHPLPGAAIPAAASALSMAAGSGGTASATPVPGSASAVTAGQEMGGIITSYVRQGGHGVIQGATPASAESRHFFHISHVTDTELRDFLNGLPYSTTPAPLELAIVFVDAGYTKPTARFPEARTVRFRD